MPFVQSPLTIWFTTKGIQHSDTALYTYVHVCVCACICEFMGVCMHAYINVVCVCVYASVCVCMRVCGWGETEGGRGIFSTHLC